MPLILARHWIKVGRGLQISGWLCSLVACRSPHWSLYPLKRQEAYATGATENPKTVESLT
ncbi:hypothetical protein FOQG_00705 [Fusarium oxysporum f. sp. raphani 54005]|uniref:Uncharacterized protein n=5 Tax=Fusarium oxysporum TaxID=5507 RepID=W9J1E8_FUSOX|nr:hypothetical protein FOYG_03005 [Fusarium oxysporum NRRL 32931]EXA49955.1 hypothetical protein FOVG_02875 [Fusarium oxysporum f. sp. pisi HDV247]EXL00619.1 hypothetical protein FOQG_00705 [Fusarium oxysporum f. sp. raphani 54005]EXL86135.1 hypothetical protein FOPG_02305 [Fusarium oxysporum f. sp. conglutinans race 2 54008]EXM36617.1 hypothetical protein FOTG_00687 [Fusarium oxysporum f. sp. vasinfectum 25433]KAI8415104.1 hypothetical protein FOFC_04724 [Fusarium oxysporum]